MNKRKVERNQEDLPMEMKATINKTINETTETKSVVWDDKIVSVVSV